MKPGQANSARSGLKTSPSSSTAKINLYRDMSLFLSFVLLELHELAVARRGTPHMGTDLHGIGAGESLPINKVNESTPPGS